MLGVVIQHGVFSPKLLSLCCHGRDHHSAIIAGHGIPYALLMLREKVKGQTALDKRVSANFYGFMRFSARI